jgi:hypothetical protein
MKQLHRWQQINEYKINETENRKLEMHLQNILRTPLIINDLKAETIIRILGKIERIIIDEKESKFDGKKDDWKTGKMKILKTTSNLSEKVTGFILRKFWKWYFKLKQMGVILLKKCLKNWNFLKKWWGKLVITIISLGT